MKKPEKTIFFNLEPSLIIVTNKEFIRFWFMLDLETVRSQKYTD
jgi:hypothetical protein